MASTVQLFIFALQIFINVRNVKNVEISRQSPNSIGYGYGYDKQYLETNNPNDYRYDYKRRPNYYDYQNQFAQINKKPNYNIYNSNQYPPNNLKYDPNYNQYLYPNGNPNYQYDPYDRPYLDPNRYYNYRPSQPNRQPSYLPTRQSINEVLYSIAQNDNLQCVPKLICEMIADSGVGVQKDSVRLPFNIDMSSLIGLLSVVNGVNTSPLIHFSKAALLGISGRTDKSSCYNAYPNCPQDPDKLVQYLNNHNGGFFRYFNGNTGSQQYGNPQYYRNKKAKARSFNTETTNRTNEFKDTSGFKFPEGNKKRSQTETEICTSNCSDKNSNIKNEKIQRRIQNKPGIYSENYNYINYDKTQQKFENSGQNTPISFSNDDIFKYKDYTRGFRFENTDTTSQYTPPIFNTNYNHIRGDRSNFKFPNTKSGRLLSDFPVDYNKNVLFPIDDIRKCNPYTENCRNGKQFFTENKLDNIPKLQPMYLPDRTGTGDLRFNVEELA